MRKQPSFEGGGKRENTETNWLKLKRQNSIHKTIQNWSLFIVHLFLEREFMCWLPSIPFHFHLDDIIIMTETRRYSTTASNTLNLFKQNFQLIYAHFAIISFKRTYNNPLNWLHSIFSVDFFFLFLLLFHHQGNQFTSLRFHLNYSSLNIINCTLLCIKHNKLWTFFFFFVVNTVESFFLNHYF